MMQYRKWIITGAGILLLALTHTYLMAQDRTYFRYKNEQGVQVMSDVIPVKYASKGYQIVDIYGHVVKVVPPEVSAEEKKRIRLELAEKERLAKWDEELLSRYSSINDINAAKKRKLRNIDTNIFTLRLTLNNIRDRIKVLQANAAGVERSGEKAPESISRSIEQLQEDRQLMEEEIEQRLEDKKLLAEDYDRDIARFIMITRKK